MSIKFICSCGKHLRARDEMAARRSVCPACGAPVGIPSRQPTHPGTTAGPMTPLERLRARKYAPPADTPLPSSAGSPVSLPHDPPSESPAADPGGWPRCHPSTSLLRLVTGRGKPYRPRWPLETHWYQCLLYPCRTWLPLFSLAAVLNLLSGIAAFLWPEFLDLSRQPLGYWLPFALCLLPPLLVAGCACGFVRCVLSWAVAGETRHVSWPGRSLGLAVKGTAAVLTCFLAGPVVPAAGGVFYWISCGDPQWLDWVILAELCILATGYWLFAFLAVCERNRLRDANPFRIAEVFHRMGYRALVATLLASTLTFTHGLLGMIALLELHRTPEVGWLLLAGCWLSGLFWGTFLLRLVGVWCYRCRLA